jgi:hypothetical protein
MYLAVYRGPGRCAADSITPKYSVIRMWFDWSIPTCSALMLVAPATHEIYSWESMEKLPRPFFEPLKPPNPRSVKKNDL